MIRKSFVPIFAALLLITSIASAAPIELKVMSFNIRYGTADDGDNKWRNRRDTVCRTIEIYEPDIVGTQETLKFQAKYILEQLPEYQSFGLSRKPQDDGERMEIFYKKDVVAPIQIGHFWLSETPNVPGTKSWDSSLPRMATWTKFWHFETEQYFYYLNTHFDHRGPVARKEAARIISEQLETIADKSPVIITGDFNAKGDTGDPWKEITKTFQDAWLTAEQQLGPPNTFGGFLEPVVDRINRIDWILYRGPIQVKKCETVLYEEQGRYPSDHYPIFSEMVINIE